LPIREIAENAGIEGLILVGKVMLPELAVAINALLASDATPFLLTALGRPFASAAAFGNRFADWCRQAGLKPVMCPDGRMRDYRVHGLRKAACTRLAEACQRDGDHGGIRSQDAGGTAEVRRCGQQNEDGEGGDGPAGHRIKPGTASDRGSVSGTKKVTQTLGDFTPMALPTGVTPGTPNLNSANDLGRC
jgi:hypothetical protein